MHCCEKDSTPEHLTMDWLGEDESLSMSTFSWKRWTERFYHFTSVWVLSFVCCFFFACCAFLSGTGIFLQLLHRSLSQYKRFADRPSLELDRLPQKKTGAFYMRKHNDFSGVGGSGIQMHSQDENQAHFTRENTMICPFIQSKWSLGAFYMRKHNDFSGVGGSAHVHFM